MYKKLIPTILSLFLFSAIVAQTYYGEMGRPAQEIESNFPYDISIRNGQSDTLNTATVFENNGKPTILLFWLTTCGPCRMEMAAISKKYDQWKNEADFNLYAISIDWPKNAQQFLNRVEQSNWPFPAYHDFNREFGKIMPGALNGLPQTFVLNEKGEIVHHKRKYRPGDEDALFGLVKEMGE